MQIGLVILGIAALAGGLLSGIVADAKNRNVLGWVIAGALFPLLGLIAIAGMPVAQQKLSEHDTTVTSDGQQDSSSIHNEANSKSERNTLIFGTVLALVIILMVINITYG